MIWVPPPACVGGLRQHKHNISKLSSSKRGHDHKKTNKKIQIHHQQLFFLRIVLGIFPFKRQLICLCDCLRGPSWWVQSKNPKSSVIGRCSLSWRRSAHCPTVPSPGSLYFALSVIWCGVVPARTRPWSHRSGFRICRAGWAWAAGWGGPTRRLPSGRKISSTQEAPSVGRQSSRPPRPLQRRVPRSRTEPPHHSLRWRMREVL